MVMVMMVLMGVTMIIMMMVVMMVTMVIMMMGVLIILIIVIIKNIKIMTIIKFLTEYDNKVSIYIHIFSNIFICICSFVCLFFFTYALLAVVYVSHVEDRFVNTPRL
jgi:hypothetical protein